MIEQIVNNIKEIGQKKFEIERMIFLTEQDTRNLKPLGLKVLDSARFFVKDLENLLQGYEEDWETEKEEEN